MFQLQSKTKGEQTALINEMIGNQKVVQAFSHEDEVQTEFDEINQRLGNYSLKATFFSSLVNPSTRFVNSLVYAAVGVTGALSVVSRGLNPVASAGITVGQLTCFLTYANQYTKPFNEISGVITELQNACVCAERIFELIETEPEPADAQDAYELEEASGRVSIQEVCFSYNPNQKLIEDFNLEVEPGWRVAIVGPTGCGKTTFINLLMRFYDVNSGKIAVGENGGNEENEDRLHDIMSITRRSLRNNYGMVLQETWLFDGTVMDNIRYGKLDATDEEVYEACRLSGAEEFIKLLPEGFNTRITENGENLSGGQKQLITIARAFLKNPAVLILDEATSSVDTRTELLVQKGMTEVMKGRTNFVVAHRLSTIRKADEILFIDNGTIRERGTHEELLEKQGLYYAMYKSGFGDVVETTERLSTDY
jgi:ATP-binding cassette subfamily B protein